MIIKFKEIATTTIPLILVPAQIINIGAKAVLGRAFKTIKYGSNILSIVGIKNNIVAIIKPNKVPIIKPIIVSITDILI